jgi:hypothetical protein
MPKLSDDPDGAVGAEKSPRKVAWFIFGVFVVLVLALGIMLLVFRHHAPVPQTGGDTHSSKLTLPSLSSASSSTSGAETRVMAEFFSVGRRGFSLGCVPKF